MHGYWRLKKENEVLLLRIEQLDQLIGEAVDYTSRLEDKVEFMFGDAKAVMHLMYYDGLTLNEGEYLLDEVYA
jgi:hypothetical protein